jgi:hypothetical protein
VKLSLFKSEVIRLTEVQAEGEDRTSRLEAFKKALDLENEKLKENMEEKEALLKVSLSTFKCLAQRVLTLPPSCGRREGRSKSFQQVIYFSFSTGIGERYSQSISIICLSAPLVPM